MTVGLCETRPPEWWDSGDPGNRLAVLLCRVCPARDGDLCRAGRPDPRPKGVIRAGVAYNERGGVCPTCERCGYPNDDPPAGRPRPDGCRHCRVPQLRSWTRTFHGRTEYFAARHRLRKAGAL